MQAYRYQALDAAGRSVSGVVEAESPRQARSRLREQGLLPSEVEATPDSGPRRGPGSARIAPSELSFVTAQLASLIDAGLTFEHALQTQIDAASNPATRAVLATVRADIASGQPVAVALARHPRSFPEFYTALMRAAEESGAIATVLRHLARYLELRETLKQKTGLALLYPVLVTIVAAVIVLGLLTYVVPQVVQVFAQSRQTLPLLTRMLIALADFLKSAWPWLLAGVVLAAVSARFALRATRLRLRCDALLLRIPGLGPLILADNTARLAGTLGILVEGGVPPFAALQSGIGVLGNHALRKSLIEVIAHVREGMSLARALSVSAAFPPLLVQLVASGEASGKLADMLTRAAQLEAALLERRLAIFMTVLGPLLILLMGGAVLLIVLAILLPIIEINQLVR